MLDVIARLLLSAGIMVGTAYLPAFQEAGGSVSVAPTRLAEIPYAPAAPFPVRLV
jgi:hypothetical protein